MAKHDHDEEMRDRQVKARLDLLRAQQGGGLLGITQHTPASENDRAQRDGDAWRPPLPTPMSGFAMALAAVVLALIAIYFAVLS